MLTAIGAFLLWGPIGIGNGPLSVQMDDGEGWTDSGQAPVGFILPMYNSGTSPAVIDAVDLVGGTLSRTPAWLTSTSIHCGCSGQPR